MNRFTMSIDDKVFLLIEFTEQENEEKTKMTWDGKGYYKESRKADPFPENVFSFSFSVGRYKNEVEEFEVHSPDPMFSKLLYTDLRDNIVAGIMGYYKR